MEIVICSHHSSNSECTYMFLIHFDTPDPRIKRLQTTWPVFLVEPDDYVIRFLKVVGKASI